MLPFKSRPQTIMSGLGLISKGWGFAKTDKWIMIYSIIPIIISLGFLYLGFEIGYGYLKELMFSFTIDRLGFDFFGGFILLWISKVFFKALAVIMVMIFSYLFLQIIYIPFYSILAERVLKKEFGIKSESDSLGKFLIYTLKMIRIGLLKSVIFLLVALFCFALSFIPPLGFLPLFFGLFVIAYDAFDYALEILGLNLKERLEFIRKEFFMINGHTFALGILSFIPVLVFLFLPFAVVGGALTVGEMYEPQK